MGIDQWREEQDWPLPDTSYESWYLHGSGRANPAAGDGRLSPDAPAELSLDLSITSNVFLPGHRIRLEISSSNFPRYDRNSNTGGVIAEESADQVTVAVNRILHGPACPRPGRLRRATRPATPSRLRRAEWAVTGIRADRRPRPGPGRR